MYRKSDRSRRASAPILALPALAAASLALVLVAPLVVGGCSDFDDWDYDRFPGAVSGVDAAACEAGGAACDCGGEPVVSRACNDCLESMVGKAMRFRELTVTEPVVPTAPNPEALPTFLNGIWQEDVRRYILNIMLRIDEVDLETGTISFVGGAGWHDLSFADLPGPGDPATATPSTYYLLPGSLGGFTVTIDESCNFEPVGATRLGFHPGPADHNTICAPEFESANAIPIEDLRPFGAIAADCNSVVNGRLEGCIPKAAAQKICSWGPAPDYSDWYFRQNDDFTPRDGTPDYCKHWCGTAEGSSMSSWVNFGGFVQAIRVPLSCDSDGDGDLDGYGIAGNFTADLVDVVPAP